MTRGNVIALIRPNFIIIKTTKLKNIDKKLNVMHIGGSRLNSLFFVLLFFN